MMLGEDLAKVRNDISDMRQYINNLESRYLDTGVLATLEEIYSMLASAIDLLDEARAAKEEGEGK